MLRIVIIVNPAFVEEALDLIAPLRLLWRGDLPASNLARGWTVSPQPTSCPADP